MYYLASVLLHMTSTDIKLTVVGFISFPSPPTDAADADGEDEKQNQED